MQYFSIKLTRKATLLFVFINVFNRFMLININVYQKLNIIIPLFMGFGKFARSSLLERLLKRILFPRVIPPICFYNLLVKDNMSDKAR